MQKMTVQDARDRHFENYGLPPDGGYEETWIPLKFGFLTLYLYNSESRKRAVKLHDIHHVVTGYKSNPKGEAEISAWELAAGIYDKHFARVINLAGLFYGAFLYPRAVFRAYVLGKHSSTLYNQEFTQSLLGENLECLKKRLLPEAEPMPKLLDYIYFSLLVGLVSLAVLGLIVSSFIFL